MADFDDAAVARELTPNKIDKMTCTQLKCTLTAILGAERSVDPSNIVLSGSYILFEKRMQLAILTI
ncbi:hypothetical protein E2C01_049297 [Portunus trituberculatus]|uniref:Uncharacterized protein n=1 Tax=Portunus trituberculatus TaxID=210409 RepID=A0A5B7GFP4_PORTR|nr:hypothetical protein [Portunus trituberculatus]